MQRIHFLVFASLLLALSACQPTELAPPLSPQSPTVSLRVMQPIVPLEGREPLTPEAINRTVLMHLQAQNEFRWDFVDDYTVWSAAMQTDSLLSIGYQPEGFQDLAQHIHEIDVNAPAWKGVKTALINYIVEELNRLHPEELVTAKDILAFGDKPLPYFNVHLSDYEILASLRNMNVVRYVEPMGYGSEQKDALRSGSGCDGSAASNIPATDYTTVTPGAKVSWNYYEHNIPAAWAQSEGDNIVVGLIDTGIKGSQNKLNSQFASGWSTGRFRQKYGFHETCSWWFWCSNDGPNDGCGHGTSMAGTIAAPRTSAGSTVGVAYKSDLVSVRGAEDVILNTSNEKDGVSDAYYYLGSRSDVKIISMSMGDVFSNGQITDAINYADNQGKLMFCAAGTSLSWTSWWGVIFPANLSNTVAVTGVKTGTPLQRCTVCHDGSQVDFVVTMEDRNNSNRTPITLSFDGDQPRYTGGSSIATATTAGMAALVWAQNPAMNRTQVLDILKGAASIYPARDGNFGWGQIDALAAVSAVP